jgi:hypothetical protein
MFGDGSQTVLVYALTFRPAQVGSEDYTSALLDCVIDRGKRGRDPRIIVDFAVLYRNVEVNTDENPLSMER